MESIGGKVRQVPEGRIKRLQDTVWIDDSMEMPEDFYLDCLFEQMGREITAKLREFNKYKKVKVAGRTGIMAYIDVIVPYENTR